MGVKKTATPMDMAPTFAIDLSERFPHLGRAPIVEAVIHWRARSDKPLQPLLEQLKAKLPDYPKVQAQQELQFKSEFGPHGTAQSQAAQWYGHRLETADGRKIAQFTRNGFVFSRIREYEDWDRFAAEARRLWSCHVELAQPSEIERLGVRFINRIVPVDLDKLDQVLTLPPRSPNSMGLPIREFLHRSQFNVPGHRYRVNVIQASQPPTPPETHALGLILDIDVFTTATLELDAATLDTRLAEMRWLKNRAFFSLVTPRVIERLKEFSS